MNELTLSFQIEKGICEVVPEGRLDPDGGPEFEAFCLQQIEKGERCLLFDMAGISFVSSAGLRSILVIVKKLDSVGGKLALCKMQPMVAKIFDHSGFSTFLQIKADKDSALAALDAG